MPPSRPSVSHRSRRGFHAFGAVLFRHRENAIAEPVAETIERALDAVDIREVSADA
jgi:hypothetical protein